MDSCAGAAGPTGRRDRGPAASQLLECSLWIALVAVLSPVLSSWVTQLASSRLDHHVLLAPVLLWLAVRRAGVPEPAAAGRQGLLLLCSGLAAAIGGLAVDAAVISRIGAVLAITGLGVSIRRLTVGQGLLLLGAIPIPFFVVNLGTPEIENLYAAMLQRLLAPFGAIEVSGPLIRIGPHVLELVPQDSGLRLASVGWVLAWWRGLRVGRSPGRLVAEAAAGAVIGALVQIPGVILAGFLLALGSPAFASLWLASGLWLTFAVVGMAWTTRSSLGRCARSDR